MTTVSRFPLALSPAFLCYAGALLAYGASLYLGSRLNPRDSRAGRRTADARQGTSEFLGPVSEKAIAWTKYRGPDFEVFYGQRR